MKTYDGKRRGSQSRGTSMFFRSWAFLCRALPAFSKRASALRLAKSSPFWGVTRLAPLSFLHWPKRRAKPMRAAARGGTGDRARSPGGRGAARWLVCGRRTRASSGFRLHVHAARGSGESVCRMQAVAGRRQARAGSDASGLFLSCAHACLYLAAYPARCARWALCPPVVWM